MNNQRLLRNQIFAGIGLGLLIGIIAGLSVSPVVKTILGTLAALMGAFLGLQGSIFKKGETSEQDLLVMSLRAGSFGVACALAIVGGVLLRTHNVLGISIEKQVKEWTDAGFKEDVAKELVIYDRLKLLRSSDGNYEQVESESNTISSASGFLFSKKTMTNYCVALSLNKFKSGDPNNLKPMDELVSDAVNGFKTMSPPVQAYADYLSKLPTHVQFQLIGNVKNYICHLSKKSVDYDEACEELNNMINGDNVKTSLDQMTNTEVMELQALARYIQRTIDESEQKELLSIIQGMTCAK